MWTCKCENRNHSEVYYCKLYKIMNYLISRTEYAQDIYEYVYLSKYGASQSVMEFMFSDEPVRKRITTSKFQIEYSKKRKIQRSPFVNLFENHMDVILDYIIPFLDEYAAIANIITTCQTTRKRETSQAMWKSICLTDSSSLFKTKLQINLPGVDICRSLDHRYARGGIEFDNQISVRFSIENLWGYRLADLMQNNLMRNGTIMKNCELMDEETLKKNVRDWSNQFSISLLLYDIEAFVCGHTVQIGDGRTGGELNAFVIDAPEMMGKKTWTKDDFFKAIDLNEKDIYDKDATDELKKQFKTDWFEFGWKARGVWDLYGKEDFCTYKLFELKKLMDKSVHDIRPISICMESPQLGCELLLVVGLAESGHFVGTISCGTYHCSKMA